METDSRLKQVQEKMRTEDVDIALYVPGPDFRYLSGVQMEQGSRMALLVLPSDSEPFLLVSELERPETDINISYWSSEAGPFETLRQKAEDLGIEASCIALDDRMWERDSRQVREEFDARFELAGKLVDPARMTKDLGEIEKLEEASRIADKVMEEVREMDAAGMKEGELAARIDGRMRELGGEEPSFDTIVAAGENGANPHHRPGERRIEQGEPVVIDFGCFYQGYASDQTRTLVFGGEPDDKVREVHEIVRESQQKGVEAVEPGVEASEVDRAAREVIEDAGYSEEFMHSTGHGVGLEVHESPSVSEDSETELEKGMAITVEPGVYIEGEFGMRIEDLVVVTGSGCRRLNSTSKDLS